MADFLGGLLGGIGSLAGSLIGQNTAENTAAANIATQEEYAKNAIRWKVRDAKLAGVHPLYALGANTTSFAPVSVGDSGLSQSLGQMGQGIGRAINYGLSGPEREQKAIIDTLQLERAGLENDLLRARIASENRLNQSGATPAFPIPGIPAPLAGGAVPSPGAPDAPAIKVGQAEFTPNRVFMGMPMVSHPGFTNAETEENRSGEMSDYLYGLLSWPADIGYSASQLRKHLGYSDRPWNLPDAIARSYMRYMKRIGYWK